jgi:type IV pilus assembly protein PilA
VTVVSPHPRPRTGRSTINETLSTLRAKRTSGDHGFTLIELLVVVVIIGILVAIAIPLYLNYRKGAANKSASSDIRGAISAVEQFYTENSNAYPVTGNNGGAGNDLEFGTTTTGSAGAGGTIETGTVSPGTTLSFKNNGATYVLCATNSGGTGTVYVYNSSAGGSVKTSTESTVAACITAGT